ncbi:MAG: DNA-3-methyladenine glycosylase 2 family protein [Clostridia bacterium]|nr:DNA-3-methyladenine glycosylase 2 family protein [Clostridia bacterium]
MKLKAIKDKNNLILEGAECFDVGLCLDCGQAFRWERAEDGTWQGIAMGKFLRLSQNGDKITLFDTTEEDFNNIWHSYFDLDRDYNAIISTYDDKSLLVACNAYPGIRILKQDEWEALCSFIISANNNIPRIKGIIGRLCEQFGNKIEGGYTFPTAQALAGLTVEDLAPIRSGFRAKYIIDAAQKVASGEVDIEQVKALPFDEAKAQLLKIKGVGEKVAQCTLLYGFGRVEAFPRDVWVNRIVAELYPDGLPECIRDTEGIAQQYLFHWRRNA